MTSILLINMLTYADRRWQWKQREFTIMLRLVYPRMSSDLNVFPAYTNQYDPRFCPDLQNCRFMLIQLKYDESILYPLSYSSSDIYVYILWWMSELLALMHVKNKIPIFWCVVCGSFIEFDLVYTNGNWFCSSLLIYIDWEEEIFLY